MDAKILKPLASSIADASSVRSHSVQIVILQPCSSLRVAIGPEDGVPLRLLGLMCDSAEDAVNLLYMMVRIAPMRKLRRHQPQSQIVPSKIHISNPLVDGDEGREVLLPSRMQKNTNSMRAQLVTRATKQVTFSCNPLFRSRVAHSPTSPLGREWFREIPFPTPFFPFGEGFITVPY